ncbi:MAG: DUF4358 domain-containing protein [Erysipelotrichaceae bacterium]
MKKVKILLLIGCFMLVSGCSSNTRTCDDGAIDINAVFNDVNEKINDGTYHCGLFQDQSIDASQLSQLYGINASEDLLEFNVRIPMINVSSSEIAMFHVKNGKMDIVKQGVAKRIKDLEEQWKQYLPDQYEYVKNYKTWVCGDYYYMVIAEDSEKILDYMKDK